MWLKKSLFLVVVWLLSFGTPKAWTSVPNQPAGLMQISHELEAVLSQFPFFPPQHTFEVEHRRLYVGERLHPRQVFQIEVVGSDVVCECQPEQELKLLGVLKNFQEARKSKQVIQVGSDLDDACPKGSVFVYGEEHFYDHFELVRDQLMKLMQTHFSQFSTTNLSQVSVLGSIPYVHVMNMSLNGKAKFNFYDLCEVRGGSKVISWGRLHGINQILVEIVSVPNEAVVPSTGHEAVLCPTHTRFIITPSLWQEWLDFKRVAKDALKIEITDELRFKAVKEAQTLLKASWVQDLDDGLPCQLSKGMKAYPLTETSAYVVSKGDAKKTSAQCEVGSIVVNTQKYRKIF